MADAFVAALKMLGRRDYFAAELRDKLERKGVDPDAAAAAVVRCRDERLVDDERVARRFVELRGPGRGWGPRRLCAELRKRGVDSDLAERISRIEGEIFDRALAVALKKGELRRAPGWWALPRGRAQMLSSLLNRGFDRDTASAAVAELAAGRERQDHERDDEPGDPGTVPEVL